MSQALACIACLAFVCGLSPWLCSKSYDPFTPVLATAGNRGRETSQQQLHPMRSITWTLSKLCPVGGGGNATKKASPCEVGLRRQRIRCRHSCGNTSDSVHCTGTVIVKIVGMSEQTAAPRMSSAVVGAKLAFFRMGKEKGRYSINDPLQLSISSDDFKFILDLTLDEEEHINAFCQEHQGQFVQVEFDAMLKKELDGSEYQTKKGFLFGLVTGLSMKPVTVQKVARERFMQKRRSLRDIVTGQDKQQQSGNLSD